MINQTILIKFMQRRKIKFDVACNGREAVDKWRVGGFHLVLVRLNFLFPIAALMLILYVLLTRCTVQASMLTTLSFVMSE